MTFDIRPPGPEHADQDATGLRRSALRAAIGERLLVADGAMGSMLQGCLAMLGDFAGHEGCHETLNVTRPDRAKVRRLLRPERIGVTLSEEFQLAPEQSTDAVIAHHPEAKYFST
jgi:hypothetical protein